MLVGSAHPSAVMGAAHMPRCHSHQENILHQMHIMHNMDRRFMPQEMDNYILGVGKGRDNNVVSRSGLTCYVPIMLSHFLSLF